ncbi:MAG: hypothetical protein VX853_07115, partial [Pseudomonadota bacterium]|nr:hypothetical protein [Pseudomonadota bacterium]
WADADPINPKINAKVVYITSKFIEKFLRITQLFFALSVILLSNSAKRCMLLTIFFCAVTTK